MAFGLLLEREAPRRAEGIVAGEARRHFAGDEDARAQPQPAAQTEHEGVVVTGVLVDYGDYGLAADVVAVLVVTLHEIGGGRVGDVIGTV